MTDNTTGAANQAPPPPSFNSRALAAMPTVGSVVGSALGMVLAGALHLDPLSGPGAAIVAAVTAGVTGLVHWISLKIGVAIS